jgi:hypothetical protein
MPKGTKDNRARSPKEQRVNFLGNMGGLMNVGAEERALVAQLADVLTSISGLQKPALVARICGNALREWGDVAQAHPEHARDLAGVVGRSARGEKHNARAIIASVPLDDPAFEKTSLNARLQANYEVERQARGLIVSQVNTGDDAPAQTVPRPVMRPPARHP